ncbi:uridine monophosphate kinase [Candidatus Babeliales bacterium]|nr:uridine monophosphate kinase [Candidatus Babeliales bacterium]
MKRVLIKISGQLFDHAGAVFNKEFATALSKQLVELQKTMLFGIVIGGGNFFRGHQHGQQLGLPRSAADTVGMLATMMNGVILHNFLREAGIDALLLSALEAPQVAPSISQQTIDQALRNKQCIIFAGGTGNPFVSTDTNAIIRALQIDADQVWKATNVDAVYDADPSKNVHAKAYKQLSYQEVMSKQLKVMDSAAIALAQEHNVVIRVFDVFAPNALLNAASDQTIGSTIS